MSTQNTNTKENQATLTTLMQGAWIHAHGKFIQEVYRDGARDFDAELAAHNMYELSQLALAGSYGLHDAVMFTQYVAYQEAGSIHAVPSTPEEKREQILAKAQAGDPVAIFAIAYACEGRKYDFPPLLEGVMDCQKYRGEDMALAEEFENLGLSK